MIKYTINNDDLKADKQKELCYLLKHLKLLNWHKCSLDESGSGGWKIALESLTVEVRATVDVDGIQDIACYIQTNDFRETNIYNYLENYTISHIEEKVAADIIS